LDLFCLDGKVALVTGGARGIGKGISAVLGKIGATVIIADIDAVSAETTVSELKENKINTEFIDADITKTDDREILVKKIIEKYRKIDILVNNAGMSLKCPAENVLDEDWRRVIELNLHAPFFLTQLVGREMIKQHQGKIINVTSMSAFIVNKGIPQISYNVSKTGLEMMTKCFAAEWAKYNIQVNALAPGYVLTPLTEKAFSRPEIMKERTDLIPMGRIASPKDIYGTVVFLASKGSDYVTGQSIVIDGGYTLW